jgi:sulfate/thiosulfate-binding protein
LRSLLAMAIGYLILLPAVAWLLVWQQSPDQALLNVSYDPTRELWKEINREFIRREQDATGQRIAINQSHGGSGSQARAVIDGLEADVVSLAMWPDTDAIRKQGLIAPGWEDRLKNRSLPYYSTIVFVVREGNPKNVRDWDDLIKPGVTVITPNPKTSGNGKLTLLAAWGAKLLQTKNEAEAEKFVTELYKHAPILDAGARGSAMTFVQKRIGDVHIAWENEAHLEKKESGGRLELVYPSRSIKAEPQVALVDAVVDRKGTRAVAERYLNFLYSPKAQEIIAEHHYRPSDDSKRNRNELRDLELFDIKALAPGWDEANIKFFGDGGVFDRIYQK